MNRPQIAIIDFGSQYTHLITRRIRQLGVLAVIYHPNVSLQELEGVKGIILSGGPKSVHDHTAVKYNRQFFSLNVPMLGVCYGHQLLADHFGGLVKPGNTKEYGFAKLKINNNKSFFKNIPKQSKVWMSHGDSVKKLPAGFSAIAETIDCQVAAMANDDKKIYGVQFHPEVAHSEFGLQMISNFIFDICQCKKDWSLDQYWQEVIFKVKQAVGDKNVFLLVSGGVDSTVCFALLEKVLGKKRVLGVHIDNGFMRAGESAWVKKELAKAGFDDLEVVDAEVKFLKPLDKVFDPEKKRQSIGKVFLQVKDEVMASHGLTHQTWMLGQGTIYPDTIETGGTKHSDKIKTHHNRVKEVLALMKLKAVVEPLVDLYKDEVRAIGKKLGLPKNLLDRHPFPGPGLSIRVLCSNGEEKINNEKIVNTRLSKLVGQGIKSAVLPVRSVGVQGDNRTYRHPAVLQGNVSWKKLHDLSVRITNEIHEVNRVCYAVSPKNINLKNFKIKSAYLTKQRLDLLRQVDAVVTKFIKQEKLYQAIWQMPVVLAPLSLKGGETIILRPVASQEAMTVNFFEMPKPLLNKLAKEILNISGVDAVLYDITNKPPGTIEWE
jgi:GMP synthase (glutamine-hydrolysing)